jgi:cell pole-organizing protein PopZ
MKSPIEELMALKAEREEFTNKITAMEQAAAQTATQLADSAARVAALEAEAVKHGADLAAAVQTASNLTAELAKVNGELAAANDTISGKAFRHVAGVSLDKAAAVAGGGEAGEDENKPFATKADALRAYGAICRDSHAAQDFRRKHWAILGLSKPA